MERVSPAKTVFSQRASPMEELKARQVDLIKVFKIFFILPLLERNADGKFVFPAASAEDAAEMDKKLQAMNFVPAMLLAENGPIANLTMSLMNAGKLGSSILSSEAAIDGLREEAEELRVSNEADADEVQDEHGVPYKRRVQLLLEHGLELLLLEL